MNWAKWLLVAIPLVWGCSDEGPDAPADEGVGPVNTDTGVGPVSTGTGTMDTGTGVGPVTTDSGVGPVNTDTGTGSSDTGTGPVDTGTGTSDTGTGPEPTDTGDPLGFYFEAGPWHGYGYTGVGEAPGGTVSALSADWTAGQGTVCVNGTLVTNYSSVGLLGMAVAQERGSEQRDAWTPGTAYGGVYVALAKNIDTPIRMNLKGADGATYCAVVPAGGVTLAWSQFATACWGTGGTPYDPSVGITAVELYAPGQQDQAVSFDYCVSDWHPVTGAVDTETDTGTPDTGTGDTGTADTGTGDTGTADTGTDTGANHGKFVGNITTNGQVRSDFVTYWNQITPENEGKWGSVEPQRDQYNWGPVQAVYDYAKQHGILFKQHTFVWGSQYPNWITSLSPSEQAAEIEEWIRDFCTRFPQTDLIDVVNEATPGHAPAEYARSAFGDNWIIRSFELARQYCPNAVLILNDYNVLSWNTEEFISMARPAVQAGVVDAIGLQAHGLENRSAGELQAKLDHLYDQLGLPMYVSEYDVARPNDQEQLQIMQSQFPVFYNHPHVVGITLWGYVLGATWVEGSGLIQSNGTFRPAMTWLMDYLGR